MFDYISAAIFGLVQGVTEFLPISSSGHLVVLHKFIDLPINNEIAFDVFLHLATLFAVLLFFRKDIFLLIKSWFSGIKSEKSDLSRLSWCLILGTIPAVVVGLLFGGYIEKKLHSPTVVSVMLIVVGVLFIVFEKIGKQNADLDKMNFKKALLIGSAQALALVPGTSRSGITIIAGLYTGLKREAAIKFSFLLSILVIAGASIKEIPEIISFNCGINEMFILITAFIFSFFSGVLTIKYFLRFSRNHSLSTFAFYRFILAVIILLFFL